MWWVFAVLPTLIFAYVAGAIHRGKIRNRESVLDRRKEPRWFWFSVATYLLIGFGMLLPIFNELHKEHPASFPAVRKNPN